MELVLIRINLILFKLFIELILNMILKEKNL